MIRYVARRLVHAALVMWAAFTASFILLYILPGDQAINRLGGDAGGFALSAEGIAALRESMGLDQPAPVQYARALLNALQGDFGLSAQTGGAALDMVLRGVPETLKLAAAGLALSLVIGIGWAILTLLAPLGLRRLMTAIPTLGVSVPGFWIGLMLLNLLAFQWKLLPGMGNDGWQTLVMPAVVLALASASIAAQIMIRALEAAMASPFVETARSHGMSRPAALFRHGFRNAVIPVVTALGMSAGYMIGGSVVVETVFARSGIGLIAVKAVTYQDTPVVLVTVVFAALVYVTVNLLVDLAYPLLDPRIDIGLGRARRRAAP